MIRHATSLDAPVIVKLVAEFYPSTHYAKQCEFDHETVLELTLNLIKRGIVVIAEVDGKLVGVLGAMIVPHLFNKEVLGCHEVVWWVLPEYQKSGIGIEMLNRVDQIRVLRNCTYFQMIRLESSSPALDGIFMKLGYAPSEYCFTKVN